MDVRYPAEQKAETHERIVATASRSFREHGSEANGIGRVMKELGLTKGGFYRHFESKGDLYAAAVERAFLEVGDKLTSVARGAAKGRELRAIIEFYLSSKHLHSPGAGCPMAALSCEMARQPVEIRERITRAIFNYGERMIPFIPGRTTEEKRNRFFILFSGMAGVLVAARSLAVPEDRERILTAARSFYVHSFASAKRS